VTVVRNPSYVLPLDIEDRTTFAITALDRLHNESKPVKVKF
jgi:hypothetical protein